MYIKIPKDVTHQKKNVALGLSLKQIVVLALGLILAIYVFLLFDDALVSMLLSLITFSPFGILAFFDKNGQSAEMFLKRIIRKLRRKQVRVYKYENYYSYFAKSSKGGKKISNK